MRTPGYILQGRTFANRLLALRIAMLTLRKPLIFGVETGPFIATPLRTTDSATLSGSGVPTASSAGCPTCWTSQSNATPVASSTRRVASTTSGPMPSPGMSVTRWGTLILGPPPLPITVAGSSSFMRSAEAASRTSRAAASWKTSSTTPAGITTAPAESA